MNGAQCRCSQARGISWIHEHLEDAETVPGRASQAQACFWRTRTLSPSPRTRALPSGAVIDAGRCSMCFRHKQSYALRLRLGCTEFSPLSFTTVLCYDETKQNLKQVPHPPPSPPLASVVRHDPHADGSGPAKRPGSSMRCGAPTSACRCGFDQRSRAVCQTEG